jgi:hypothetical protein
VGYHGCQSTFLGAPGTANRGRGIPHLAKNERDMGHPLIRGTMRFFDRRVLTQTLKPHSFCPFPARLKSCPDTKQKCPQEIRRSAVERSAVFSTPLKIMMEKERVPENPVPERICQGGGSSLKREMRTQLQSPAILGASSSQARNG